MTHTPGPWTRKRPVPEDDTISRTVWAGDDLIATVHDLDGAGHEAAANARLIAAAPFLLVALRALEQACTDEGVRGMSTVLDNARKAIANATGADA